MRRVCGLAWGLALTSCSALDLFSAPPVDDENCTTERVFYQDRDGDRYGVNSVSVVACVQPRGFAAVGGDCDDTPDEGARIHPGATERCNRIDDDCSSGGGVELAEDADGDGHAPFGALCSDGLRADDCDDDNRERFPGHPEACDGLDNGCFGGGDHEEADTACRFTRSAESTCRGGACVVRCDAGWGDCDRVVSNGCEVNLTTEPAHCGACGVRCGLGAACVDGLCRGDIVALSASPYRAQSAGLTPGDIEVSAHTCALRTPPPEGPGSVLCWGRNDVGQVGVEPSAPSVREPVQVGLFSRAAYAIATGGSSACAIVGASRQVTCWGAEFGSAGATITRPGTVWATASVSSVTAPASTASRPPR